MKTVITGGLGYIGCALIDTFRDEPDSDVVVVDKDFIPRRVASLPKGFKFIQADITDFDAMQKALKDADVIYHLASPVDAEASIYREEETRKVILNGTLNVAVAKPADCLMVTASTANVFGGLLPTDKNTNLSEKDVPKPVYPYAQSKMAMENALTIGGSRNHIICRFGTAYGYSDGIRFNLVTNIFFKKMMLGQNIEVYGDGSNFRPFTHVRDLARAMRFLASSYRTGAVADKEVFHVVQNNLKIKDLAELTASFNTDCRVVFPPDKPAPFMSYNLSSRKLLDLGFRFTENLRESIEEMVKIFGAMK